MTEDTTPKIAPNDEVRLAILPFLDALKRDKSFELLRPSIRVTPKGLFLSDSVISDVVARYQVWILNESGGVAQKSLDKCRHRLFDGEDPERQYLVEGKLVLIGRLIPLPVKNPQSVGLPFYLGSLLPTKGYIHPSDPDLGKIRGMKLLPGKSGVEAHVTRKDKTLIIPETLIRSFMAMSENSRFLQRQNPDVSTALSTALIVLVGIVRRARPIPKGFPIVVPNDLQRPGKKQLRMSGKFLVIEEQGRVQSIIELNGRNMSIFLREQLNGAPRERLGTFKLTPKHRDLMGFYDTRGRKSSIHARAFSEFTEVIKRARDAREKFSGWFTAGESFERFASLLQTSQPINRGKIDSVIKAFGLSAHSYQMNGGWIFGISQDGVVLRAVAKHIRLVGQRR